MLDSHDRFDSYTLVLPISYGDDKAYCEYLKSYLNKTNLKSVIIEKFLSKEEYFKIIDNVEIGIFNSIRQMAMGNIIALLASGKAVFLRKDNPFFMHLKELGVKLYSIDQLNEYDNLTKLEIDNNNFLMQTYYGFEQCRKNTQDLLEKIKTIIS